MEITDHQFGGCIIIIYYGEDNYHIWLSFNWKPTDDSIIVHGM